jgi:DNA-binding winged helix-turn-helix (wHTH) protein
MPEPATPRHFRFGVFEADETTGELRRKGVRLKLNTQPFQLLILLLSRPGQLLTRDEIARHLWPNDTFVDFDHGINSALNRLREALSDTAANPRFIETLARRGYRFIAPVEELPLTTATAAASPTLTPAPSPTATLLTTPILATAEDLPTTSRPTVKALFIALQLMYVGFYVGALANLPEISDLLSPLPHASAIFAVLIATAAALIPVRAFILTGTLLHPPEARTKLLRLWPFLLPFDLLWSLSPFLLLHHINFGVAIACTPLLVYSPFAQRSLILMGATDPGLIR